MWLLHVIGYVNFPQLITICSLSLKSSEYHILGLCIWLSLYAIWKVADLEISKCWTSIDTTRNSQKKILEDDAFFTTFSSSESTTPGVTSPYANRAKGFQSESKTSKFGASSIYLAFNIFRGASHLRKRSPSGRVRLITKFNITLFE